MGPRKNGLKEEEWPQYVERLNHFFIANGITEADKKKSAFLAGVGPTTYALARSLVSPAKRVTNLTMNR